jgi:thermitase
MIYSVESKTNQLSSGNPTPSLPSTLLPSSVQGNTSNPDYASADVGTASSPTGLPQIDSFLNINGNKTRVAVGIGIDEQAKISDVKKIAAQFKADLVDTVKIKDKIDALTFELPLAAVTQFMEEVRQAKLATYVEPTVKLQAQFVPNDPYWIQQWGPQKIGADWAWNTTVGDHSVLVAVIDTGIYYKHPDIAPNYVPLGFNWAYNNSDPVDDFGHGTHCAGIIAAAINNSLGIAGLAQVSIMAEKVLDSTGWGYDDWLANGIINATDAGARILSISLGGYGDSQVIHDAIRYAYDSGVLIIAAAGNQNTNVKPYPAGYKEVVAVAATDEQDNKAYFSNYGDWIELSAPGVNIISTVPSGYAVYSGTSMACPHVAGVAALVWSEYPNRTRDWVREWLRYTSDDLGTKGYDIYYGYGRIDAQKAVQMTPPDHELIVSNLTTPPYLKPSETGTISASIFNFGQEETNVAVQLLANNTLVDSTTIGLLPAGNTTTASLTWTPTVEGNYNITFYVVPTKGEINVENNALQKNLFVGYPIRATVIRSAGNIIGDIIANWQAIMDNWQLFGDKMIYIDYTTLNKASITYDDLVASQADVLVISCASAPTLGMQFTNSEIDAITRYVHEGHGLVVTSGTLYQSVPNNYKLAPLFGLNKTINLGASQTDLLNILNASDQFFAKIPNPLVFPRVPTTIPSDGSWDSNELVSGTYGALGQFEESAVVTCKGLIYIAPLLEATPPYYHHHLQLLYNAMRYSRYPRPQHELSVDLQTPTHIKPGETTQLNATVTNMGLNNETNVSLYLTINDTTVQTLTVPILANGTSQMIQYLWTPTIEGKYNITAYAPPAPGEDNPTDNIVTVIVRVRVAGGTVVFEEAHMPAYSIGNNPAGDVSGGYAEFARYLTLNGYDVSTIDPGTSITSSVLEHADVLVIVAPSASYTSSELSTIQNWVKGGGNLLLISEWTYWGIQARTIAATFGITMRGDGVCNGVDNVGSELWPYYNGSNILAHPVTQGVSKIEMYAGDGITSTSPDETKLVVTDTDGTAYWWSDKRPAYGISVVSAFQGQTTGHGKMVLVTDSNIWDSAYDVNGEGQVDFYHSDNAILALNSVDWLSLRYQHDLSTTLEAPDFQQQNDGVQLNATVMNLGLSNETNVSIQLFVNDTLVSNASITELDVDHGYTLNYPWTPKVEAVYNITAYAPPVAGEQYTGNNVVTKFVIVRQIKNILFDQTHLNDLIFYYGTWTASLQKRGYVISILNTGPITTNMLQGYDVFVIPQAHRTYGPEEISAIQNFIANGGGLLVIGNDSPYIYNDLTTFAGIQWIWGGTSGTTTDITPHPVTAGVSAIQFISPTSCLTVNGTALSLIRDLYNDTMLAVSEQPPGKVLGFADDNTLMDKGIVSADNLRLANNMIDWLATSIQSDHDLAVSIQVPTLIRLGESVYVDATVRNRGLYNETNIQLQVLIDSTQVDSMMIQDFSVGQSVTLRYTWTPSIEGVYNVTTYAPPLSAENFTQNNVASDIVNVKQIKGLVLWDNTHNTEPIGYYSTWMNDLIQNGYVVDTLNSGPLTPASLNGYNVFVISQATTAYGVNELSAIQGFVKGGGGLLILGDDYPTIQNDLIGFAGMGWDWNATSGITTDVTTHPVTNGVASVYLPSVASHIIVNSPAIGLIRDPSQQTMLAVSEVGLGKVLGLTCEEAPMDWNIGAADNRQLANNMIGWLANQIGGIHDVAVTNLTSTPNEVYRGWMVQANVTVANLGSSNESFDLSLYCGSLNVSQRVDNLAPNETLNVVFSLNTTTLSEGQHYLVEAVASKVPGETNVSNNALFAETYVRLSGDVNGDGTVDILDCVQASLAFGTSPNMPKWNMYADINQDQTVNILDMILIANHFGQHL